MRDPRGAARNEGGVRRETRDARRHLPQYRLHPVQGVAAILREFPRAHAQFQGARNRSRRGCADRSRPHDGAQGRGRVSQRQGRRVSVQEEQDHLAEGGWPDRGAGKSRGRWRGLRDEAHRHSDRQRERAASGRGGGRKADRHVHGRPRAGCGSGPSRRDRGRLYRAGTRQRLAAARRGGDGHRVPRPHRADDGRRGGARVRARACQAGDEVPPRHEGNGCAQGQ